MTQRDRGQGGKSLTGADLRVVASLAVGFAGLTFHNLREFPVSVLVRGDTLILLAVSVALGMWWLRVRNAAARYALLGWGLLHVIGGGLIVGGGLGPFVRDLAGTDVTYQLRHHVSHWGYGATYLPLVAVAYRLQGQDQRVALRRPLRKPGGGSA